jgi:hypothetical protein
LMASRAAQVTLLGKRGRTHMNSMKVTIARLAVSPPRSNLPQAMWRRRYRQLRLVEDVQCTLLEVVRRRMGRRMDDLF